MSLPSAAEEDIAQNTTLAFRAPEMVDLFRGHLVNHKVDVWAIGCMVFRMAYGYIPFEGARSEFSVPRYEFLRNCTCLLTLLIHRGVGHLERALLTARVQPALSCVARIYQVAIH